MPDEPRLGISITGTIKDYQEKLMAARGETKRYREFVEAQHKEMEQVELKYKHSTATQAKQIHEKELKELDERFAKAKEKAAKNGAELRLLEQQKHKQIEELKEKHERGLAEIHARWQDKVLNQMAIAHQAGEKAVKTNTEQLLKIRKNQYEEELAYFKAHQKSMDSAAAATAKKDLKAGFAADTTFIKTGKMPGGGHGQEHSSEHNIHEMEKEGHHAGALASIYHNLEHAGHHASHSFVGGLAGGLLGTMVVGAIHSIAEGVEHVTEVLGEWVTEANAFDQSLSLIKQNVPKDQFAGIKEELIGIVKPAEMSAVQLGRLASAVSQFEKPAKIAETTQNVIDLSRVMTGIDPGALAEGVGKFSTQVGSTKQAMDLMAVAGQQLTGRIENMDIVMRAMPGTLGAASTGIRDTNKAAVESSTVFTHLGQIMKSREMMTAIPEVFNKLRDAVSNPKMLDAIQKTLPAGMDLMQIGLEKGNISAVKLIEYMEKSGDAGQKMAKAFGGPVEEILLKAQATFQKTGTSISEMETKFRNAEGATEGVAEAMTTPLTRAREKMHMNIEKMKDAVGMMLTPVAESFASTGGKIAGWIAHMFEPPEIKFKDHMEKALKMEELRDDVKLGMEKIQHQLELKDIDKGQITGIFGFLKGQMKNIQEVAPAVAGQIKEILNNPDKVTNDTLKEMLEKLNLINNISKDVSLKELKKSAEASMDVLSEAYKAADANQEIMIKMSSNEIKNNNISEATQKRLNDLAGEYDKINTNKLGRRYTAEKEMIQIAEQQIKINQDILANDKENAVATKEQLKWSEVLLNAKSSTSSIEAEMTKAVDAQMKIKEKAAKDAGLEFDYTKNLDEVMADLGKNHLYINDLHGKMLNKLPETLVAEEKNKKIAEEKVHIQEHIKDLGIDAISTNQKIAIEAQKELFVLRETHKGKKDDYDLALESLPNKEKINEMEKELLDIILEQTELHGVGVGIEEDQAYFLAEEKKKREEIAFNEGAWEQRKTELMSAQAEIEKLITGQTEETLQNEALSKEEKIAYLDGLAKQLELQEESISKEKSGDQDAYLARQAQIADLETGKKLLQDKIKSINDEIHAETNLSSIVDQQLIQNKQQLLIAGKKAAAAEIEIGLEQEKMELANALGQLSEIGYQEKTLDISREKLEVEKALLNTIREKSSLTEKDQQALKAQQSKVIQIEIGIAKGQKKLEDDLEKKRQEEKKKADEHDKKMRELKEQAEQEDYRHRIEMMNLRVKAEQEFVNKLTDFKIQLTNMIRDIKEKGFGSITGMTSKFESLDQAISTSIEKISDNTNKTIDTINKMDADARKKVMAVGIAAEGIQQKREAIKRERSSELSRLDSGFFGNINRDEKLAEINNKFVAAMHKTDEEMEVQNGNLKEATAEWENINHQHITTLELLDKVIAAYSTEADSAHKMVDENIRKITQLMGALEEVATSLTGLTNGYNKLGAEVDSAFSLKNIVDFDTELRNIQAEVNQYEDSIRRAGNDIDSLAMKYGKTREELMAPDIILKTSDRLHLNQMLLLEQEAIKAKENLKIKIEQAKIERESIENNKNMLEHEKEYAELSKKIQDILIETASPINDINNKYDHLQKSQHQILEDVTKQLGIEAQLLEQKTKSADKTQQELEATDKAIKAKQAEIDAFQRVKSSPDIKALEEQRKKLLQPDTKGMASQADIDKAAIEAEKRRDKINADIMAEYAAAKTKNKELFIAQTPEKLKEMQANEIRRNELLREQERIKIALVDKLKEQDRLEAAVQGAAYMHDKTAFDKNNEIYLDAIEERKKLLKAQDQNEVDIFTAEKKAKQMKEELLIAYKKARIDADEELKRLEKLAAQHSKESIEAEYQDKLKKINDEIAAKEKAAQEAALKPSPEREKLIADLELLKKQRTSLEADEKAAIKEKEDQEAKVYAIQEKEKQANEENLRLEKERLATRQKWIEETLASAKGKGAEGIIPGLQAIGGAFKEAGGMTREERENKKLDFEIQKENELYELREKHQNELDNMRKKEGETEDEFQSRKWNKQQEQQKKLDDFQKKSREEAAKLEQDLVKIFTGNIKDALVGLADLTENSINAVNEYVAIGEDIIKKFSKGEAGAGIEATGDVMKKVGLALMNFKLDTSGTTQAIGAAIFLGGEITSWVGKLINDNTPKAQTALENAEQTERVHGEIRAQLAGQLEIMNAMVGMGNKSVDQAFERLKIEKANLKALEDKLKLGNLTYQQTLGIIEANKEEILKRQNLNAEAQKATDGNRYAMRTFLEEKAGWKDTVWMTNQALKDGIKQYMDDNNAIIQQDQTHIADLEQAKGLFEAIDKEQKATLEERINLTSTLITFLKDAGKTNEQITQQTADATQAILNKLVDQWKGVLDLTGMTAQQATQQITDFMMTGGVATEQVTAEMLNTADQLLKKTQETTQALKDQLAIYDSILNALEHYYKMGELTDQNYIMEKRIILTKELTNAELVLTETIRTGDQKAIDEAEKKVFQLQEDLHSLAMTAEENQRKQYANHKAYLEMESATQQITPLQYQAQLIDLLKNQLNTEQENLQTLISQGATNSEIFDQKTKIWDIEKEIYNVMHGQNGLTNEQLARVRALNEQRNIMVLSMKATGLGDKTQIQNTENQIIDLLRSYGATDAQIQAQIATFKATYQYSNVSYTPGSVNTALGTTIGKATDDYTLQNTDATKDNTSALNDLNKRLNAINISPSNPLLAAFVGAANVAITPKIPKLQGGTKGFRTQNAFYELHPGEAVLNPEATASFDKMIPGFLDAMNTNQSADSLADLLSNYQASTTRLAAAKMIYLANKTTNINMGGIIVNCAEGMDEMEVADIVHRSIERQFAGHGINLGDL